MESAKQMRKWAAAYPDLGREPLPIEPNVSPQYFERERERLFNRAWLSVGRAEEIARAEDYFVRDIKILNTSIIIVRGQDGVIRGFHNVCRHRGNKLVTTCRGSARGFNCGFHGWTYDTQGALRYVPDEDQFYGLEKSDLGLQPVPTDIWEGFVFINVDSSPTETLQQWIGEQAELLGGYPFAEMAPVGVFSAYVNANWKVCIDVAQESYHIPFLHRKSVPDSNSGGGNPYAHFPSLRLYKRHRSACVYANPEHKPTPAEAIAFKYGPTVLQGMGAMEALPKGVNPERSPYWAFDANFLFPNLILLMGNGWYVTHRYWPVAVDRTLWETSLSMRPAKNAGERIGQEFSKIINRDLLREDFAALESVQKGLASGVLPYMPLSDQEIMLRHNYKVVEDFVGA